MQTQDPNVLPSSPAAAPDNTGFVNLGEMAGGTVPTPLALDSTLDSAGDQAGIRALLRGNALQNRLLTTFLPTALVPLLLASALGYGIIRNRNQVTAKVQLQNQSLLASEATQDFLNDAFKTPASVASNPSMLNTLRASAQQAEAEKLPQKPLEQLEADFASTRLLKLDQTLNTTLDKLAKVGGLAELFITERNGLNVAYSQATSDFVQSDEDWWKNGKAQGRWISDPEFDESSQSVNVDLVQSVVDDQGQFLGVIKAGLPFNTFSRIDEYLNTKSFKTSEQIQVLDTGATQLLKTVTVQGAGTVKEVTGGEAIAQLSAALSQLNPQTVPDTTQLQSEWERQYGVQGLTLTTLGSDDSQSAKLSATFRQGDRQYAMTPIVGTDWVAIASLKNADINAASSQLLLVFLGTAVVLGGIAALLTQILAKQLSLPLTQEVQRQQEQTEAIQMQLVEFLTSVEGAAQGDLTVHAEVSSGDMGTVADFFNLIVDSLRQILIQVKQSAGQVNQSVSGNEAAIRQLADESLKQTEEISNTLQSVEAMAQSIQMVASSANRAAEVSRSAATTASTGEIAMDKTVETILNLRGTVAETAKKVKRLGESSQQISKVVALINQIALKTNLLAVNASIEAARAGEEGEGFAVVAEEVGALAEQSATATKEIEKIVEGIQKETNEVVEAMEVGTSQVVEGTRLVEDAKTSLVEILSVSRQINELLQSISEATVSQTQTSDEVAQLMQKITQVSRQTSESSRTVSDNLQQTVEIAQDLEIAVGQFKVGTEI